MKDNEINNEIDVEELVDSVGYEFLDFLVGEKVISEGYSKKTKALVEIDLSKNDGEILMEADARPASHNREGIIIPSANVQISYEHFVNVWQDPVNYPDQFEIFTAFGVPHKTLQGIEKDTLARRLRRVLAAYDSAVSKGLYSGPKLVSFGKRRATYGKPDREEQSSPTRDDIFAGERGRRNQTTATLDRLNAQELLSGEFYSNKSRIPKQRWAAWLKFWDRRRTRVRPNKGMAGRAWQKHFLMGYQIDRQVLFEIWYNTMDSSFMIHDQNGAELGRPVATLQEAMRYFVNQITTASEQDADIFAGGGVNNQVANSMMRAVAKELSKDSAQAEREAMLAAKSEQDLDALDAARQNYKVKKLNQQLKSEERVQYAKELGKRALEVPVNLQRSAYIKMMNAATATEDKVAVALRASFEYAVSKAKDERELQGYMIDMLKDYLSDDIESVADIVKLGRGFLTDPNIRAEIKARMKDGKQDEQEAKREEIRQRVKDAEEKFRKANEDKIKDREEIARKAREKAEKAGKKALGDKFDVLDRSRANKKSDQIIKKYQDQSAGKRKGVNEAMFPIDDADFDAAQQEAEQAERELMSPQFDQHAASIRNMAERSPYTQGAISAAVMGDLIYTYNTSRIPSKLGQGRMINWFKKKWFQKRRGNPTILPTDKAPVWDRMRQSITGKRTRADFVVGYSLNDKVNIEIWYVTEWDFESNKPISSFHVFDVTSQTVIRRYLPYYRNAVTVAMAKIGLTA